MSSENLIIEPNGIFVKFVDEFTVKDFNLTLEIPEGVDLLYLKPSQHLIDNLGIWISGSTEFNNNINIKVRTLISWKYIKVISVIEADAPEKELPKRGIGFMP